MSVSTAVLMAEEGDELRRIRERKLARMMEGTSAPSVPVGAIDVTDADFDGAISGSGLAVVDCWAPWCGPCKMLSPVIDSLAQRYAGQVTFLKLNTDQNQRTAARFAVMSIPTVLIFKNGQPVERMVGAQPENVLDGLIRRHL